MNLLRMRISESFTGFEISGAVSPKCLDWQPKQTPRHTFILDLHWDAGQCPSWRALLWPKGSDVDLLLLLQSNHTALDPCRVCVPSLYHFLRQFNACGLPRWVALNKRFMSCDHTREWPPKPPKSSYLRAANLDHWRILCQRQEVMLG